MDNAANNIDVRHFSTHAIEALTARLKGFHEQGYPNSVMDEMSFWTIRCEEALFWLNRSIKFIAPPDGQWIERLDIIGDDGIDFPRLPFESICLEYELNIFSSAEWLPEHGDANLASVQPDRVCVLAFYPTAATPLCRLVHDLYGPCDKGEFVVWAVWGNPNSRQDTGQIVWAPPSSAVIVTPSPKPGGAVFTRTGGSKRIGLHPLTTLMDERMAVATLERRGIDSSRASALLNAVNDLANEALAVAELCNVLQCTNVHTESLQPPEALNAKRSRNGKVPFFEYRILKIDQQSESSGTECGGSHGAPRLHYRRGHIRRLQAGRKTWVRPAMVGDKSRGLIVKDYDARPNASI